MTTKSEAINNPGSCLNKAAADEPVFVLRAKDPLAAAIVMEWAATADETGHHEHDKIDDARRIARHMQNWREQQEAGQ